MCTQVVIESVTYLVFTVSTGRPATASVAEHLCSSFKTATLPACGISNCAGHGWRSAQSMRLFSLRTATGGFAQNTAGSANPVMHARDHPFERRGYVGLRAVRSAVLEANIPPAF